MPTPQQLLAQAGRKPQDLSRANAATGTIQGANGGTQQLGPSALRRMQQQPVGQSPPIMAPQRGRLPGEPGGPPITAGPRNPADYLTNPGENQLGRPDPATETRSMTGGGLQAPMSTDVVGIPNGVGAGGNPQDILARVAGQRLPPGSPPAGDYGFGGFNLPGFKPAGDPLGIRPLPTTTNFDMGRPDPTTAARPQPGAALGGVMPASPGKPPSPVGNPAAGWSVGGPPAPGGGPDVRPPGLPGFKPAGGMLSKPVAPGLPGGDPPQSPDGFGGGKPRQLPFRRNGVTDVGRNSMAGF